MSLHVVLMEMIALVEFELDNCKDANEAISECQDILIAAEHDVEAAIRRRSFATIKSIDFGLDESATVYDDEEGD